MRLVLGKVDLDLDALMGVTAGHGIVPASILRRLPVRLNYDDDYYASRFQGIPLDGYTTIVERLLDRPAIAVRLGERFTRASPRVRARVF